MELLALNDMHVHLRQGAMLSNVLPVSAAQCDHILVMPNTNPPVTTPAVLVAYRASVGACGPACRPLFTFQLTPDLDPAVIPEFKAAGAVAAKLYPVGVTTNSQNGFSAHALYWPMTRLRTLAAALAKHDTPLCVHGELPGAFCLDREDLFIPTVKFLLAEVPDLKVVLEHITTCAAVKWVAESKYRVAATITLHHMVHTLDDVVGGPLRPHHFCKPLPKWPEDRTALRVAATSGSKCFFLGSDSAPHSRADKESCGCAGVFTAPVLAQGVVQVFDEERRLAALDGFVNTHARHFYNLPETTKTLRLAKDPTRVPAEVNGVVPLWAGETIPWRVE